MQFVNFTDQQIEPFDKEFADDIIAGSSRQKVWSHFVGADGRSKSGMLDSTVGVFRGPKND